MQAAARTSSNRFPVSTRLQRWFRTARQLRAVDLALHPTVQRLEDRSYPGQAPGVMGWALAGTGLAFLDQSLLTFPLDGGASTRPALVAWQPDSGASPSAPLPAEDTGPSTSPMTAWIVTLNPGESQPVGAELTARPFAGPRDAASVPAGSWQSDLLPDPLEGPLARGGLDDLGDTPAPRHPWSWPSPGLPAADSSDFSLSSGPAVPGGAPIQGGGLGLTGPTSPGISEAELTALASTRPAGISGKLPPSPVTPDAATLQTLAANGITWNGPGGDYSTPPPPQDNASTSSRAQGFLQTPLRFEPNLGQKDARAQFYARASDYSLFLTSTEMVLALYKPGPLPPARGRQPSTPPSPPSIDVLRMQLVGANANALLTGANPLPVQLNYLMGRSRSQWVTHVPTFAQVAYHNLYPGIDILYYGNDKRQLEYDFVVAPGANAGLIQLAFTGTQGIALDAQGNLVLHTAFGDVTEHAPIMYQIIGGARRPVSGHYVAPDAGHVSFQVGTYDATLPLIIDPFLSYSTYFGSGYSADQGNAITTDSLGDAFVTGGALSLQYPTGSGVIQGPPTADAPAFVAKFNPIGQKVFVTYVGGSALNWSNGIALDASSNIYIAGATTSTDFPTSPDAFQTTNYGGFGGTNAFMAKIQSDGTAVPYATYLGGSGPDQANGIALDSSGNILVTGSTASYTSDSTVGFPVTSGAVQPVNNARQSQTNAFVTKFSPPPNATLVFSTYLGGWAGDSAQALALDFSGNAYITGSATSNNFPVLNPFQANNASGPLYKASLAAGATTWTVPNSGLLDDISALAVYPTGPTSNLIYAGDQAGNIYKKTDQAANWTLLRAGHGATVTTIVTAPSSDPNNPIIYASFYPDRTTGYEIFSVGESPDGGQTWVNFDGDPLHPIPGYVYSLARDPSTGTLFAGVNGYGVFEYDNTQQTWVSANGGGFLNNPYALAIDPVDRTIYEGGETGGPHNVAWTTIAQAPAWNLTAPVGPVRALAVDTTTSHPTLYAGGGDGAVVFESQDQGATWTQIANGLPNNDYVVALAIDTTTSPSTIYAGTIWGYVFKTTSGSGNWTPVAGGPNGADALGLASPGTPSAALYVGTELKGNAFVTKLNPAGNLVYSTYLGGNSRIFYPESGQGIAVDSAGDAYITGLTSSANFPATIGAIQPTFGGGASNAFVSEINPGGSQFVYSTYIGGNRADQGTAIAIDGAGDAYIIGLTSSDNFPTFNAYQAVNPKLGNTVAFVTKITSLGSALAYSTYLGQNTSTSDYPLTGGLGIAVDSLGNAYLTGTAGPGFPLVSPFEAGGGTANEAFVAKLTTREIYNNSNPPFGDLGNPQDTGGPSTGVYLNDGEFHDQEVDLQIPGRGLNWQFARSYRTGVQFDSPLGRNWDLNYNRRLWLVTSANQADINLTFGMGVAKPGDVVRIDGSNRADLYTYNGATQSYTAPKGSFTHLVKIDSSHFWERDAQGMVYTYLKPSNSDVALMTSMADREGDTLQFIHQLFIFKNSVWSATANTLTDGNPVATQWLPNEWAGQSVLITSGKGAGQIRTIVSNTANQLTINPAWDSGNIPDGSSSYSVFTPNQGPLTQVIDTLGRTVNYQSDVFGHLLTVQDYTGRTLQFKIDLNENLVQVTSPAVIGTPNLNDFPRGKTAAYGYTSGLLDDRLNHELQKIIAPNEFAAAGSNGTPRLTLTYDQNRTSPTIGRVLAQTVGGTNASSVPAGGTISYVYPPTLPMDHHPAAVSETDVTNRNGNVTQYQFDAPGDIVRTRVLTNSTRIPRTNQPAFFQTDSTYNTDYELLSRTYPEGNSIVNVYDNINTDRYEQGNLLSTTQNPGPRGGDQTAVTVSYTYEPIYNQVRTITDPRGIDMNYRPPILLSGEMFPDQTRYQTVNTFDYQEGNNNIPALAQIIGETATQVTQLLNTYNIQMGLGDINGDGNTNQTAGNVIRVQKPSVNLLPGSNQAVLTGSTVQPIVTLSIYNSFGLLTKTVDPEGNVNQYQYYPVTSPGSGMTHDAQQGGYLAETLQDTTSATGRDNGGNPAPANITHQYTYDQVGNLIADVDGRHIETDYLVNQLNQVVQVTQAISVPGTSPAEPLSLIAYQYMKRYFYDYNNNVILSQTEDRGNTANVAGEPSPEDLPPALVANATDAVRSGSTSTTLVTALTYPQDSLIGKTVQILSGPGIAAGQVRTIVGNQNQTITIDTATPWTYTPALGDSYAILNIPAPFTLVAAGQVTASSSSTLSTDKDWSNYNLAGAFVEITGGRGAGQVRVITSTSANQLTLASVWATLPDATSTYVILSAANDGTAFVDTVNKYDILDQTIETLQEVTSGGLSPEFVRTRYRYDPNGHQVLTIYPEGNADASIYDERDLLFQSITGATAPPPQALLNTSQPPDPSNYDVRGGQPATTTFNYDGNGNLIETVAADDTDGSAANNSKNLGSHSTGGNTTTTLNDTTRQWMPNQWAGRSVRIVAGTGTGQVATVASNTPTQLTLLSTTPWTTTPDTTSVYAFQGDRTRYVYDGFDRKTSTVDSVGNQTVNQYDPAGNLVRVSQFGPVGGASPTSDGPDTLPRPVSSGGVIQSANLVNPTLLAATETSYDELNRAFQTDQVLFVNTIATKRLPNVADGATDIGKGNINPGANQTIPGAIQTLATGQSTDPMNDPTHLTDANQHWMANQLAGATIQITAGQGVGQVRLIQSNSTNQVTITIPWTTNPNTSSQYIIQNALILGRVTTRTEYDRNSRLTFTVQDDGDIARTDYDGISRVIKTTDPEGNLVQAAYDADSNVIETSQTDVSQVTGVPNEVFLTTNFYDSLNRLQETVNNLGNTSYRRYDSLNHLVAVADAQGPAGPTINRRAFPAGALTVNTTNNFGNVTLSYYDGLGRKTRDEVILTASHQGDGTHAGADINGVINSSTIPTPDISQGGGDGIIRTGYLWDQNSQQVGMLDDQGNLTVYLYDNLNRQVADIKGLVVTSTLTNTALLGSRTIATPTVATLNNPAIIPTAQIDNQLTEIRSRVSAVRALFPSLANQVVSPLATLTGYDPDNNVLLRVDPNGTAVYTKYDAINRPLDVRVFRAGQTDSFTGDPLFAPAPANLPPTTSTVVGTTKQDFQYDGLSRRTSASDNNDPTDPGSASLVTDAYDSLGRTIEESQQVGSHTAQVVSSAWRAANLRSQVTYPNTRVELYRYDHLDRVQSINDNGTPTPFVTYAYIGPSRLLKRQVTTAFGPPAHTLTETFLDSTGTMDLGYDGLGRPIIDRSVREDGSLVVGFGYIYDRMSNKISQRKLHVPNDSELYTYDSAYRLLTLQRGTLNAAGTMIISQAPDHAPQQTSWNLDGAGNFQQVGTPGGTVNRTFSSTNALLTVGSTSHSFDSDGNETNDGTYQFTWDFENRLRTVTQTVASQPQLIASYAYNADGQRDRQVVSNSGALNGETNFYLDGDTEIENHTVTATTDTIVKQYIYGADVNEPVMLDLGGTMQYFYSQDKLGSVYALTNASGQIKEGYLYDAYGQQTVFTPGLSGYVTFTSTDGTATNGVSALGNDFMYTGMHFDAQTAVDNLYYDRARYYNSVEARFISWDPKGSAAGDSNLYGYTGENPTNDIDPSGLEDKPANLRAIDLTKLSYMRCAMCHGDPQGHFKNIAVGGAYQWSDLPAEQQMMLQLQSTYRPGTAERGVTRAINNALLGPLYTGEGILDAAFTGVDQGVNPVVAALGSPFYAAAKAIQNLELSAYLLVTGQGSVENAVDVGMALAPFLPKLARWGKASQAGRTLESFRGQAEAILARNKSPVGNLIMEDPGQWEIINPLEVQDRLMFREIRLDRRLVDAKIPFDLELAADPNLPVRIVRASDGNLYIMKGNKRMMSALESNAQSAKVKIYTVEEWERLTEGRFVPRGTNNPRVD